MQYLALAMDYDGTLAKDGQVCDETIAALERAVTAGRKLLLVTGRFLEDLQKVFPRLDLFTYVVAENGALLYQPATSRMQLLGEAPPQRFIQALQARGVTPLGVGRVIVATWRPHETTVIEVIRELGLERQVIFNKGAVMVLPTGVNKGSGMSAALQELLISPHNVVAIGDAENDHSFLSLAECTVAVQNALPALKDQADFTTKGARGDGVIEIVDQLLADDLQELDQQLTRHMLSVGTKRDGNVLSINTHRMHVLFAGASGGGKSTLATSLLEQLAAQSYQFCLIDPEGDYESFQDAMMLGNAQKEPGTPEILQLLEKSEQNAILNLLGTDLQDRPSITHALLPILQNVQTRLGHPHWLAFDEAHHLFPPESDALALQRVQNLFSLLFITSHPEHMSPQALALVDVVIAVGNDPLPTLHAFAEAVGLSFPETNVSPMQDGEVCAWFRRAQDALIFVRPMQSKREHQRHRRKYAEGDLGPEISFYFRGPEGKLHLQAHNLVTFSQMAQGVDDETWLYHLHRGDYARWFREVIKDKELALIADNAAKDQQLSAQESRARILSAIEKKYTLPA
jgi:hydroxymethylpyrimidine pyrophosphatase-like HAD family hydrolase